MATFQPNNYQLNSLSNGETIEIISNAIQFCIDRNLCSSPSCLNWFFSFLFFSTYLPCCTFCYFLFYFIFLNLAVKERVEDLYSPLQLTGNEPALIVFHFQFLFFFLIFNEILFFRTYPPSFSFSTIAAREKRVVGSSQPIN